MNKNEDISQFRFLSILKAEKTEINIYLLSGIKLNGIILDFSDNVIILKNKNIVKNKVNEQKLQMIYLHSISTISPAEDMVLDFEEKFK